MNIKYLSFLFLIFLFVFLIFLNIFLPIDNYLDYVVYNECLISGEALNIEIGFTLLCKFTKNLPEHLSIIIPRLAVSIFFISLTYYIYKEFGIYTALFHFFLNGFQTLGGYRQAIATLLLTFALILLLKNKKIKCFFFSFISFFFHISCIYFFFLFFFKKFFRNKINIFFYLLIIFFIYNLFKLEFLFFIDDVVLQRYQNLLTNSLPDSVYFKLGNVWYLVFYSYFSYLIFKNYKLIDDLGLNKIFNFYLVIILIIILLVILNSWAAVRISTLVNPATLVFFALVANKIQRFIIFILFFVRFFVAFIAFFLL